MDMCTFNIRFLPPCSAYKSAYPNSEREPELA